MKYYIKIKWSHQKDTVGAFCGPNDIEHYSCVNKNRELHNRYFTFNLSIARNIKVYFIDKYVNLLQCTGVEIKQYEPSDR